MKHNCTSDREMEMALMWVCSCGEQVQASEEAELLDLVVTDEFAKMLHGFISLTASHQKEVIRYINFLKADKDEIGAMNERIKNTLDRIS